MIALPDIFSLSGFDVQLVGATTASLQLRATSTATHAPCPDYAAISTHVHSHYRRTLADLPCSGRAVTLTLHLDPDKPYLVTRFQEGCQNACALYREIQHQGYPGSRSLVRKFITWVRRWEGVAGEGTRQYTKPQPQYSIPDLGFAVLRRPEKRSVAQQELVVRLTTVGDPIRIACDLTQTFARIIRDQQSEEFTPWLQHAATSGVPEFRTFVTGLRRDEAAVRAALALPWNNGPTEGNINRLKLIKRAMYGRGNFDLLRQRMLYAA
jgi:transposase